MKKFGPDYYNISDELTEEELLIQQTAHEFVQNEFIPVINEHFEQGHFQWNLSQNLESWVSWVLLFRLNLVVQV